MTRAAQKNRIVNVNAPYYLEDIQNILITTLYTSAVRGAVPVSLVLVGEAGVAKSKMLMALVGESIHHSDSFSSTGLFDLMAADSQKKLRWIITPDLNPTLSRRPATVNATVANLLTLTMDGTCRVDDGRKEKLCSHPPIGFMSAMTPDIYAKQAKKWLSLGLRRRIIPIFYDYTSETTEKLKKIVREDKISGDSFPPVRYSHNGTQKPLIDDAFALRIESLGTQFSVNLGLQRFKDTQGAIKWYVKKVVPISPITTLRTLARANALRHSRTEVAEPDIEFLVKFIDFTNQAQPKQI